METLTASGILEERLDLARKPQRVAAAPFSDSLTGPECIRTPATLHASQLEGRKHEREPSKREKDARCPESEKTEIEADRSLGGAHRLHIRKCAERRAPPRPRPRVYSITDLGTLGGSESSATAINDRGEVVGYSTRSGDGSLHAFRHSDGRMIDLLPGPTPSFANDINNRGEVVGTEDAQAFLYRRGQVTNIGPGGKDERRYWNQRPG